MTQIQTKFIWFMILVLSGGAVGASSETLSEFYTPDGVMRKAEFVQMKNDTIEVFIHGYDNTQYQRFFPKELFTLVLIEGEPPLDLSLNTYPSQDSVPSKEVIEVISETPDTTTEIQKDTTETPLSHFYMNDGVMRQAKFLQMDDDSLMLKVQRTNGSEDIRTIPKSAFNKVLLHGRIPLDLSLESFSASQIADIDTVDIDTVDIDTVDIDTVDIDTVDIDTVDIDTEDIDTEDIDTEDIDTEDIDTEDIDTEDIDTEDIDTEDVETEDVETEDVETEDIETEEVDTEEVDTEEVDTEEVDTEEVDTEEVDTEEVETEEVETEEVETEEVETEEISF
ncbi:hypothetical protein [Chitinivibrio alkaliphilus]|uniref:Uncharacterized protein n=1 Tax=Chitinivibrio alkaliphilus ACht1 TaxID=1313304 RepID=U7D6Z3_9BACT|nr:hypothetical protein [Chitinivibrio alkaliphilus]ERP30837.1 hypothetical protein CALK_2327 [Chitinivibrio alkaliphilus ACht1]